MICVGTAADMCGEMLRPQPARCVDTHSNMWSSRICILSVLPIPVKYLSKRQKKLLMASPIRNERNSSKALHYINREWHSENFNRMVLNFI
eukprot:Em0010g560a